MKLGPLIMPHISYPKILTAALALAGALAFSALQIPLAFLFGPMAICLILALCGVKLQSFTQISSAARTILGVAVGASITMDVVRDFPQMIGSLLLVPIYILAIGIIGVPFFYKLCKFDWPTAYYSAMPGGLQDMVLFGCEAGGDPRILSLVHATRVLIVVTLAPVILTQVFDLSLSNSFGVTASEIPISQLILMLFAGLAGWKIAAKIGLFGASITGPLCFALGLSLSGVLEFRPPNEAILVAQFFIGTTIGVYYVGITWGELRKFVLAGVAFTSLLACLAVGFGVFVSHINTVRPIEVFLAFSPGGQAEMTVLALASSADLGFVVIHHLVRLITVITGAPLVAMLLLRLRASK